jgi:hypothetical protein
MSEVDPRMVERAYRDLETAGYSRSTLRTLHLILDVDTLRGLSGGATVSGRVRDTCSPVERADTCDRTTSRAVSTRSL